MSSSGRSSLLVALGHRAVARKCEQLASRPSAFKSTGQPPCTRKSCLKREGSPEPSLYASTELGGKPLPHMQQEASAAAATARRMSSSDTDDSAASENEEDRERERERARRASEAQEPTPLAQGEKGGGQGKGACHLWAKGGRGEGEDSGEETEGAEAYDAEVEGQGVNRDGTQGVHGYQGDEEDQLADRLYAQHLIMERPELQRFDSADAAMHAWHRKQEDKDLASTPPRPFRRSHPRSSSEGVMADTPPPLAYEGQAYEGQAYAYEGHGEGEWEGATPPMHSPCLQQHRHTHHGGQHEGEQDDGRGSSCGCDEQYGHGVEEEVFGLRSYPSANSLDFFLPPAPPSLQHFDSADHYMAKARANDDAQGRRGPIPKKAEKADKAEEEEKAENARDAADGAAQPQGHAPMEKEDAEKAAGKSDKADDNARGAPTTADGYRSVASWFIRRGETRSKRLG